MNTHHDSYTNARPSFIIPSAHSDNNGVDPPYLDVSPKPLLRSLTYYSHTCHKIGYCSRWHWWFISRLSNAQVTNAVKF